MKEIIETAKKHKKCPFCNKELYTVKRGEVGGEELDILKEEVEKTT